METTNKKNKIWKKRVPFVISIGILCVIFGVFIFMESQITDGNIKFIYKDTLQDSAQVTDVCSITAWDAKDVGLKILDHEEDVSEQVQVMMTQTEKGMDVTYTWKEESFILHVADENYIPPTFSGPKEIEVVQGEVLAKNFSAYEIVAKDSCGKDISERIDSDKTIDTNTLGEQEVLLSVQDDMQHKSEYPIIVRIIEDKRNDQNIEYHDGIANPLTITPKIISNPEKIDVLVNKFNALPDDWTPSDLVNITSNNDRTMQLRQEAATAYERMNAAALQNDITIRVVSAYRTKDYQQSLFNNYYNNDPLYAYRYSALPRRSEHETGLAIDVSYDAFLYDDLHTSDLGKWMDAHAHEYGFMLRFLDGKETITNYAFEPWHYRYVGIELATKIKTSGLTMEEYYGSK